MNNNAKEQVQKAEKIYASIRDKLEPKYNGKIIAIEIDSGNYFLGKDELEAYDKAVKKYPGMTFVYLRVGYPTTHVVGAF